jgi:hypothetical protein
MATSSEEQTEKGEGRLVGRRRTGKRADGGPKLGAAVGDARESIETMLTDLRDKVEEHPWRALGLALGAGYIVGGGLFTALTGRLLFTGIKLGTRLAALPLVRDEVMGFIGTLADRGGSESERRHQ